MHTIVEDVHGGATRGGAHHLAQLPPAPPSVRPSMHTHAHTHTHAHAHAVLTFDDGAEGQVAAGRTATPAGQQGFPVVLEVKLQGRWRSKRTWCCRNGRWAAAARPQPRRRDGRWAAAAGSKCNSRRFPVRLAGTISTYNSSSAASTALALQTRCRAADKPIVAALCQPP